MNILYKSIVLKLNKTWIAIGECTVAKSFIDLCAGVVSAIDIQYDVNDDGMPDYTKTISMLPLDWEQWIQLPIRPWDNVIHTAKSKIRVPTVVITKNFGKVPKKMFKHPPSNESIYIRDGKTCQYTGQLLTRDSLSIDHIIPKSKGGTDDWTNLVTCHRQINSKKGNRSNQEMNLKLIKQPVAPLPMPISMLINEAKHPDWEHFIQLHK